MNALINHNGSSDTLLAEPPLNSAKSSPAHVTGRGRRKLLAAIVAALIIVGYIVWQHSRAYSALAATTDQMAVPTVATVEPRSGPAETDIQLPGNLMAYSEASIYARTNGYLKAWYTDIGAKVTAGQLMADIETPDVDAQLRQATANLFPGRRKPGYRAAYLQSWPGPSGHESDQPAGV